MSCTSCRSHGFGLINPNIAVPFQKNPILSAFFRVINRADELGSGIRKLMRYGKTYGGEDPQLIEGDNFRMIITVPEFGGDPAKKTMQQIVQHLQESLSTPQLLKVLGYSRKTRNYESSIKKLLNEGYRKYLFS